MYIPFNNAQINIVEGTYTPSTNKNFNNQAFDFWIRALFQRACSTLIIDLPKEWSKDGRKDLFYYILFRNGYLSVFNHEKYGTVFQPCTLYGFDLYYQPTNAIITNPALPTSLDLEIGSECEIIKLCPDYKSIWDIIQYYAEKLALCDSAINMALINSKLAYIFGGKNKASGQCLKKIVDKINKGEPTVVFDMKVTAGTDDSDESPWHEFSRNVKESYITSDLLQDFQTILNAFDCEIGIPTVPYQKKERMVTSEAESKQLDATSRATVWYETLKTCIETVNEKFNLDISVELRFDYDGGENNVTSNNDNDGVM